MELVTVLLPKRFLERIDELVREGLYSSRSDSIRSAVRLFLKEERTKAKYDRVERAVIEMRNTLRILQKQRTCQ
jgi:Arc/MetJ-type ribon-helix-helix transcriptional regulator